MRKENEERVIYVIPSFLLFNLPFPQIGIYMGADDSQDFFCGQDVNGEPKPITKNGDIVAWDYEKGYYAGVNYRADIIAGSKDEVIWLSRLCQRAIAANVPHLEKMGVVETRIGAADTKLEQEHFPALVFSRAVIFTGKSLHTWSVRVPAYGYETGINTALTEG
jgi:hypothetical protein